VCWLWASPQSALAVRCEAEAAARGCVQELEQWGIESQLLQCLIVSFDPAGWERSCFRAR